MNVTSSKLWDDWDSEAAIFKNLHMESKHFYNFIRDSTSYQWTDDHRKTFQMLKDRISEITILPIPSTEYPHHIFLTLEPDVVYYNNSKKGGRLYPSIRDFLTRQNSKCQLSTGNCVE